MDNQALIDELHDPEYKRKLAIRGEDAWPFEAYLCLTHRDVAHELELVVEAVRDEWQSHQRRKSNARRQKQFMTCTRAILTDVLRAWINSEHRLIGIAMGKAKLDAQSRYRPPEMTTHYLRTAVQQLVEQGKIKEMLKGYHFGEDAKTTRYQATTSFLDQINWKTLKKSHFGWQPPAETIILRDEDGHLTQYQDTSETIRMRQNLTLINDCLEGSDITQTGKALATFAWDQDGYGKRLHRVFNNGSFEQGGRFYGGWWQSIRKQERKSIHINGNACVEVDFSGFNPSVLLAEAGLPIPPDPYALIDGVAENRNLRSLGKSTLAAYLNGATKHIAEPKDFDEAQHGMTVQAFRASVLRAFPMVKDMIGTNMGLKLMYRESQLAEKIMLHFAGKQEAVLPIHDSFMVEQHLEAELSEVMSACFNEVYGQTPHLKVKQGT